MYPFPYYVAPSPSFHEGMSRILDFGDTFSQYNVSSSECIADEIATAEDWQAVWTNLRESMNQFADTCGEQPNGRDQQNGS